MKSAFLLSGDSKFFNKLQKLMADWGAQTSSDYGGFAQLQDPAGRLFTLFGTITCEWEVREGPFIFSNTESPPNMETVSACVAECRWEDYFKEVVERLASGVSQPIWVLDGNGVIWDGHSIDTERLQL